MRVQSSKLPLGLGIALIWVIGTASLAAPGSQVHPFPLQTVADLGNDGFEFLPSAAHLSEIARHAEIRLVSVPLPEGDLVDLDLERVTVLVPPGGITLDGVQDPATVRDLDLTLWKGTVVGVPGSDVFLAFSSYGSRGWIKTDRRYHLTARPGDDGSWADSRSVLISEDRLVELGVEAEHSCQINDVDQPNLELVLDRVAEEQIPRFDLGPRRSAPLYECRIAIETDNQYFDLFGDFNATRDYLLTLLGAISDRYREQVGTILTYPYIAIYSPGLMDPWTTQESGGGAGDLLNEFRSEWAGGNAPVEADLYHFVSGESLGGGVAFLDVICDQSFGFGVSGNTHGRTPLPVIPNHPLNWDFMVISHELGHNFSTPHTHSFCPPLDNCPPSQFWGQCQTETVCTDQGTIMSYCHLCSGGLGNVTTFFHPAVVSVMRNGVENSCLELFRGVFTTDLAQSLEGSNGTPRMEISFDSPGTLNIDVDRAPISARGGFIASFNDPLNRPYRGGGVLVPRIDYLRELRSDATGDVNLSKEISHFSFPVGDIIVSQMWFIDPSGPNGYAATNAIEFELILP